jgi:hypothetical protein
VVLPVPRKPLSSVTGVMPALPSVFLLVEEEEEEEEEAEDEADDALSLSPRLGIFARPGWTGSGHRCTGRRGRATCLVRRERVVMACVPVPSWNAKEPEAKKKRSSKNCAWRQQGGQYDIVWGWQGREILGFGTVESVGSRWVQSRPSTGPGKIPKQGDVLENLCKQCCHWTALSGSSF